MIEDLKAALALALWMTSVMSASVAGYYVGLRKGKYQVAKHIPEIRRVERLNALAPRNKHNE